MGRFVLAALAALITLTTSAFGEATRSSKPLLSNYFGVERSARAGLGQAHIARFASVAPITAADLYSEVAIAARPTADGGEEWQCLAEALYFEARGENAKGVFAVAEVILNRVESERYPDTVCKVVNQGTGRRYACQFTFTCDGYPENIKDEAAYARVGKIARTMLDGAPRKLTDGALYYHTRAVAPRWSRTLDRTASIGVHYFYR